MADDTPILTAILLCYNFEKYAEECIDSVISQVTNFGFQVYIVDDCSTDNTFNIINHKYKGIKNVHIFQSPKNQGVTKNIKDMLDKTTTPYVFLLDGDDYLVDNNYFQRAIDFLESNPTFALYCTGYKWLHNDGKMEPSDCHFTSTIETISLNDLLTTNHIGLARVFRNYKNLIKPWMRDEYHEDWILNTEILKHGFGKAEKNLGGIYRITKSGRITSLTEFEIQEKNINTLNTVRMNLINKTITIVDSFVYNDKIRNKLNNFIQTLKDDGHEILLISNTIIDREILKNVKFYIYDHRNQLFKEKYEAGNVVDFWKTISPSFSVHDIIPETQPHGLSVLINLFNAISYAKAQGYTHFQRLEADSVFGEKSREYIKKIPTICAEQNKKGLFYYNSTDISFHYFYCEIDAFLNKVPRITREQDYVNYLKTYHNNKIFRIVEVFVHENLRRNIDSELLTESGNEMSKHFPDTQWNTETSASSFDKKYNECVTKLYYTNLYNKKTNTYERKNSYILFTYSYVSRLTNRSVIIKKRTGDILEYNHRTDSAGGWSMNYLPDDIQSILVYENGKFLYEENISDCISYINLSE
jgi:glycosyltransferase involved in cell wall biosynthesis